MKITTAIMMMAASVFLFSGCGESNSKPSKAELKARFIQKYSKRIPEEQVRALIGDTLNSEAASAGTINLVKQGISDQFMADWDAVKAAE